MRYYSTQRPVGPGTFPKPQGNAVKEVFNFDSKTYCEELGREAWGYIEYEQPLDPETAAGYALVADGAGCTGCVNEAASRDVLTDITCSKRREPWIIPLSATIGESYCCKGYRKRYYGQQTQHVGFIGLEDDVEICIAVFKYAVDCIRAGVKKIKAEYAEYASYYSKFIKQECDSYGYGFVRGIDTAFERQGEENREEWGLVLVMPKEVTEAAHHLGHEHFKSSAEDNLSAGAYRQGYAEGREFDPTRRIAGG